MYDVIIIGGGPAGSAAAIYTGRKRLKTLLITESFGGQSIVSDDIQNWVGTKSISGYDLAQNLEEHVRAQEMVEIKIPETVTATKEIPNGFEVTTNNGNTYQSKTLIVTSGGRRRKLGVPGEEKYNGRGVAYCSTCDAPLFMGKKVVVVGGGNAGLEAAIDLRPFASEIFVFVRSEKLVADPITQAEVLKSDKIKIVYNASI
ncbi:MAG: FAD-dependent oxidoreductase, partial [Candidatus Staskawiczbacteria bacterium]|nr:FAD-dependent oxidoreductase [Candidatus Staskawiczbacteria bacterium]